MKETVKILITEFVTHDVKRFVVERPEGYRFVPGQATEVSINLPGYENEKRPFTFTSLDEDPVLEFIIKAYRDHEGVTKKLHELSPGDELIIRSAWGTIDYKGPGVFIAGGSGITPFIAILRRLQKDGLVASSSLIFANKTAGDVILQQEFQDMLGENLILTLDEKTPGYEHGFVDSDFLKKHVQDFSQNFYLCGPPKMVKSLKANLKQLGAKAESVVFEE
ncbi:MAG: flavodoxin reductase [Phycisphaerae bacterium]|nr:flavodoxin reductase [Phycisphaerae bacterium]